MITRKKLKKSKIYFNNDDVFITSIDDRHINVIVAFAVPLKRISQFNIRNYSYILATEKLKQDNNKSKMFDTKKEIELKYKEHKKNTILKQNIDILDFTTNSGAIVNDRMSHTLYVEPFTTINSPSKLTTEKLTRLIELGKDPPSELIDVGRKTLSNMSEGINSKKITNDFSKQFTTLYDAGTKIKKSKTQEQKNISLFFKLSIPIKYSGRINLSGKIIEKSETGIIVSVDESTLNLKKLVDNKKNEQSKPIITAIKSKNGNKITVEPTSENTKSIDVYKKVITTKFKRNNFRKLVTLSAIHNTQTIFVDHDKRPAIYRAIATRENEFSSAVVSDVGKKSIDDIRINASQEGNTIKIVAYNMPNNVINVLLYKKSERIKEFTLIDEDQNKPETISEFIDTSVSHYNKYSYRLLLQLSGGTDIKTHTSNVVEFINPSDKFSLSLTSTNVTENDIIIEASYSVPETDTSILMSTLTKEFPDLVSDDKETIIKNYKQVSMVYLERINEETGSIKLIGYNADTDDGKITWEDKIKQSGKFKYRGTLFSRSIESMLADIKTSGRFLKHNQKFMQYIPDELTGITTDLNFNKKFFSQSALFDGTLEYGKALAYKPENIIELGKTGIIATSDTITTESESSGISSVQLENINNRMQISFIVTNSKKVDSILISTRTPTGKSIQASLMPIGGKAMYYDNIHTKEDGEISYFATLIYNDLSVGQEVFLKTKKDNRNNMIKSKRIKNVKL